MPLYSHHSLSSVSHSKISPRTLGETVALVARVVTVVQAVAAPAGLVAVVLVAVVLVADGFRWIPPRWSGFRG